VFTTIFFFFLFCISHCLSFGRYCLVSRSCWPNGRPVRAVADEK